MEKDKKKLVEKVLEDVSKIEEAKKFKPTLLSQTVFLGTLGVLFILPVVVGAYLGRWLDEKLPGYALHWTISLIILGVILGALNVYIFIRNKM
ncbi:AtpZ/AtpI family protein [Candidatus Methylacidiphilum infernorum]|uniref:AtpZ/AtpI family protein n=1 Tax=Candidatus Methylacidiphilum infernorum TaxID=511746 RepID=A0ABX7PUF8_9BACT|nr:AtpZ/AtpI family protein [Candidatus Methylacidiphilum infernorum]QSR86629.1 AtpZ/AtpI family protein [Candidatus Methylacidiphilum infernorum]